MPTLRESELTELTLPALPDDPVVVTIDLTITGGIAEDMQFSDNKRARASSILASAIKRWNIVDKSGQPEEITPDAVRRLEPADWNYLADKFFTKIGLEISAQAVPTQERKSADSSAR